MSKSLRISKDMNREDITQGALQGIVTSLNCHKIRIGTYENIPKEKVYISSEEIKIVAPSLKNEAQEVALHIKLKEIVKILVHFGKGQPVIFLFTTNKCGAYLRKTLGLLNESGLYYNPMSTKFSNKVITLLAKIITVAARIALQQIFGTLLDELNSKEAKEILVATWPKERSNVSAITLQDELNSQEANETLVATWPEERSNVSAITLQDELNSQEANETLVPTWPEEKSNVSTITIRSPSAFRVNGYQKSDPPKIRKLLVYPPGRYGISINTEDYMCLAKDQFLNDIIIDFYLMYLVNDVLTSIQRDKTHIFSTFFYNVLTTEPTEVNKCDTFLTPAQRRHARAKTWTKNVNIFDKDFIVVPINHNFHWFVAIICFPSLTGCTSMIDNSTVSSQYIKNRECRSSTRRRKDTINPFTKQEQLSKSNTRMPLESDTQCDSDKKRNFIKQPCILIFNSIAGVSDSKVGRTLRDYLTCEFEATFARTKIFNNNNMKCSYLKVPQQNNSTDCGLYLLQYVEQFFKDPILDYSLPITQLTNWFDAIVVTRKREEISNLIKTLMEKYNPESLLDLPDIGFPTLNGKLKQEQEDH